MVTLHEVITFLVSMQISISSLQTHNVNRCGRSRHLARKLSLRDRKSGSAGMPRPISYAVFCLKKKKPRRPYVPILVAALGYFVDIYDLIIFSIVRVPSLTALDLAGYEMLNTGV